MLHYIISVDDVDVSSKVSQCQYTMNENSINACDFTVVVDREDFDNANYANNSTVIVYAEEEESTTPKLVFKGIIEQTEYSLTSQGELLNVKCIDECGAVLKRMIVSIDVGTESRYGQNNTFLGNEQSVKKLVPMILHDYIARIGGAPQNLTNPSFLRHYKTGYWINDEYIWNEPSSIQLSYLSLKYMDGATALNQLLRLHSATALKRAIDNNSQSFQAMHWISDNENRLIVAPVGNHDVESTAGKQLAGVWSTYAFNGQTIDLDENCISQSFKEHPPYANFVYCAGRYMFPRDDSYTEPIEAQGKVGGAKVWNHFWLNNVTGQGSYLSYGHASFRASDTKIGISRGNYAVKLLGEMGVTFGSTTQGWTGFKPDNGWDNLIDDLTTTDGPPNLYYTEVNPEFIQLITEQEPATINFTVYRDRGISRSTIVLLNDFRDGQLQDGFMCSWSSSDEVLEKVSVDITRDDIDSAPTTKWVKRGQGDWTKIKYIGFTWRHEALFRNAQRSLYIDDLHFSGNMTRAVMDKAIHNDAPTAGVPPVFNVNPQYKYPFKMFSTRTTAVSDNLSTTPQSTDALYLTALDHAMRYSQPIVDGEITLALKLDVMAGQFIRLKKSNSQGWYSDKGQDYYTMRISKVVHSMSTQGFVTSLSLCNDLKNSTPRQYDEYSESIRTLSPRAQDNTFHTLYTEGAWDNDSVVVPSRVSFPNVDKR